MRSMVLVLVVVFACGAPRPAPPRTPDPSPAPIVVNTLDPGPAPSVARAPGPEPAPTATVAAPPIGQPPLPAEAGCVSVESRACQATMPCPSPPDRRVRACRASAFPRCGDPIPPEGGHCPSPPFFGKVLKLEIMGGDAIVTIDKGSNDGLNRSWGAELVHGPRDEADRNRKLVIIRIDRAATIARTSAGSELLPIGTRVRFSVR